MGEVVQFPEKEPGQQAVRDYCNGFDQAWIAHLAKMGIKRKTTAMTRRGDNFIKELCELFGFKRNEVLSCDDERVINIIECAIAHKRGEASK
ncbi:hypothetical protein [Roseibium sp.]|uniref:hypothetical protein n=1 Tax=Roseibium sp. TaxID=1936156 RepID=UPI003B516C67